jgi:hypothetical protein
MIFPSGQPLFMLAEVALGTGRTVSGRLADWMGWGCFVFMPVFYII